MPPKDNDPTVDLFNKRRAIAEAIEAGEKVSKPEPLFRNIAPRLAGKSADTESPQLSANTVKPEGGPVAIPDDTLEEDVDVEF